MVKPLVIAGLSFLLLILVLSALALHVQAFVAAGFRLTDAQTAFPALLFPIGAVRGGGISIPLIVAAGLAGALHSVLFRRLIVQRWRWVSEEEYERLFKNKRRQPSNQAMQRTAGRSAF